MTCESQCEPQNFEFTQGDDVLMSVQLMVDTNGTLTPLDITNYDEIKAIFFNTDGTKLTRTLTASGGVTKTSVLGGVIAIEITRAQSALIKSGEFRSFEIVLISDNGQPAQKNKIVQFKKVLTVSPELSC